jgi:hypothetical protein
VYVAENFATGKLKRMAPESFLRVTTIEIFVLGRISLFALVLQKIVWGKIPCKNTADLNPNKGTLLHRNNFTAALQNFTPLHKKGWRSS